METVYFIIVGFLLLLAVFDLFVGVGNDAVNFLNSAIGAKVAKFKTVLIIASIGVAVGAVMSAGMMDLARHGIMQPANFSFHEVILVFLAVMVTDVIVLDVFNTLGLPTSTTVSLVFELLGGAFALAVMKMMGDPSLELSDLLNSDKALTVILGIFLSVAIAFVAGIVVQWLARVVFTFDARRKKPVASMLFGGIALTILVYFIFIKGLAASPFLDEGVRLWITGNTPMLLAFVFLASCVLSFVLGLLRVNIFRVTVLTGTFALAMAFASNDLVNFIGVPLASLDACTDWVANGAGDADGFMMISLMESAKSPFVYLFLAGVVMVIAMATSKKAHNVIKTSVDLSRQDEGDDMFGSSRAARSIVRATQESNAFMMRFVPKSLLAAIDRRFNKEVAVLPEGAAFDLVRAAVNLVLASVLIVIGTNFKLPLSTTYVTFMVAMGSSLADRAWSRESAVFRVTGVMSVIGGWFVTAGVSFLACSIVCLLMYWGGFVAMFVLMGLVVFFLVRSQIQFGQKVKKDNQDSDFPLMMRTREPEVVWDMLCGYISKNQSEVCRFALKQYEAILDGLSKENLKGLRMVARQLAAKRESLKKTRKKEFLVMRRVPKSLAAERNTWFHLGANSNQQFVYCLIRLLEPVKEHVDNNFNPLPDFCKEEFEPMRARIVGLMKETADKLADGSFEGYRQVLEEADKCKDELSVLRKRHIDRLHSCSDTADYHISLVYLNVLQESQELLSIMRHQLRAGKKLME
ncbi:MAG: inorganic phosphate transporter [Bacteroidales bacterium]|nr:inorganic phosphate transporter [Bacteroidales bacterium]